LSEDWRCGDSQGLTNFATVYWIFVTATVSILTVGTNWNESIPTHILMERARRR
jgi:hypothetical protein